HVCLPRHASRLEAVYDVWCVPSDARARVRIRIAAVVTTSEIGSAGEAEIVREARIHVAVAVLVRETPRIRQARQVRRESAAVCEDVAEVLVLHDDGHEVVEVESRGGRSANPWSVNAGGNGAGHSGRQRDQEFDRDGGKDTPHATGTESHGG